MMVKPGKTLQNLKNTTKIQENFEKCLENTKKAGGHLGLALRVSQYRHVFRCFLRLSLPQRKCRIHRGFAMNVPLDLIYDITGVRIFTYLKPLATDISNPTKKLT